MTRADVVETWASGDFMYGAVREHFPPAGTWHKLVGRCEYPVARLGTMGVDADDKFIYYVEAWVPRTERFPEPIKGWN